MHRTQTATRQQRAFARSTLRISALHAATLLALGTCAVAGAQAQTAGASADAPAVQQVTISASRIDRLGYVAPTPTTVIGALALEQRATVNLGDVLNEIPAFRGSVTPSAMTRSQSGVVSLHR